MILNNKRGIVLASMSLDKHEETGENIYSNNQDTNTSSDSEKKDGSNTNQDEDSDNASTNHFKVTQLAYFKDRKFVGYLDKNDSIVYNLLQNRLKSTVLSIGEGENLLALEVNNAKATLTPKFDNDHFVIDIDVKIEANVTESGKNIRDNMNTDYEKIIQKSQDIVKGKIENAIYNYQNIYEEDIVGFENLIYKKLNSKYKEVKDNFKEEYFKNIITNINVKIDIPLEGGDMIDGAK
jgi:spore germination protein KC